MTMEYIYYFLDESGNSGSKFWNPEQPTFVEAGWAVDKNRVQDAKDAFKRIEETYPVKSKKIKGADLLKHRRGQEFILDAIREIGKSGGIPILHIVKKKYWVCGKVVETFLDPEYNSKVLYSEQWDLEKRQSIAQTIYDINSPLLQEFAEAYHARDPKAISRNAVNWAICLREAGNDELSDLVQNIVPTIAESVLPEFSVSDDPEYYGIDTMNIPVWFNMFQHIEQNTPCLCSIIHHRMDTLESAYLSAFSILKNASDGIIAFADRQWVYPLKKIQGLSFESSSENPLIRCADFIASGATKFVNSAISGREISSPLYRIGFCILGIFLMDIIAYSYPHLGPPLNLGSISGSDGWIKQIIDRVRISAKHM